MAEIQNQSKKAPDVQHAAENGHGVHPDAAKQESHGGYGGTDRLTTEIAPLHPEGGKDQAKDI